MEQVENNAPVDSIGKGRTYTSAAERWDEQKRLVLLVATTYRAVCDLEPVVSLNVDPESRSRTNRWSPDSCHYKVDTENCVRRVIEAKPEDDRPALWAAWQSLLGDSENIGKDEQRLIKLLAGPMYTRRLHPAQYFRVNRYPNRRPR